MCFVFNHKSDTPLCQASAYETNLVDLNETHSIEIYYDTEIKSERNTKFLLFQSSARLSLSNMKVLINLSSASVTSPNRPEVGKRKNEIVRYEITSEQSECEKALEESKWAISNLVDLVLSSLGPFAIMFALNVAIILRFSNRNRSIKTRQGPIVFRDGVKVVLTPRSEPQHTRGYNYHLTKNQVEAASESKAEKSVTLMLLVTTFAFLVMRTPIAVGHSLQMLLTEEKLFALIEPVTCMAAFAVAEMLAFGQHAIQFYVYLACSARFRQALLRQFNSAINRLCRFFSRLYIRPPDPQAGNVIPLEQHRDPANTCHHTFTWINSHILMCRLCLHERVVHHPSCPYFREEHRIECECLLSSVQHQAHLVFHLGDCQSPILGL